MNREIVEESNPLEKKLEHIQQQRNQIPNAKEIIQTLRKHNIIQRELKVDENNYVDVEINDDDDVHLLDDTIHKKNIPEILEKKTKNYSEIKSSTSSSDSSSSSSNSSHCSSLSPSTSLERLK
ncbi:hypothetical protein SNEBB_002773 [Seison nebaliae]|nr:hypothetical protein SNEBB_002773 [Seison nebaliae]